MSQLVPIKYIGRKQEKRDNIAGTGYSWIPGQTIEVPFEAAVKLVRVADAFVEDRDPRLLPVPSNFGPQLLGTAVAAPVNPLAPSVELDAETDEQDEQDDNPLSLPPLSSMSKEALTNLAKSKFNVDLPSNLSLEKARHKVMALMNGAGG